MPYLDFQWNVWIPLEPDSFCAGFLYGLSEEKDLYTCGLYGNACGALAVRQVGACREKILWKDVKKLIEEQGKKNG